MSKLDTNQRRQLMATYFGRGLYEEIGEDNYAEVVRRNQTAEKGICHSHDFCDANMVMHAAFTQVHGFEPALESDEWIDEFNAAWDIWRAVWKTPAKTPSNVGPNGNICTRCGGAVLLCRCPDID
jgi:hypothetical protein